MKWKDPEQRTQASYRRFVAYHLLSHLTEEEIEAIRGLDSHERKRFVTRLQKALEGDIRYPFPWIRVDCFPSAGEPVPPNASTNEAHHELNPSL